VRGHSWSPDYFWRDWIEILTGWDPDNHSGAVEWIVVVGLLVAAVAMGLAARRHWRLPTAVPGKSQQANSSRQIAAGKWQQGGWPW
jgi:protein-S-isoprenylcysteine O-methyltransferase Ste14